MRKGDGELDLYSEPLTKSSDWPDTQESTHQVSRDRRSDQCIRAIDQDPTDN